MLSTKSDCVFVGFILYVSGIETSTGYLDCGQGVYTSPSAGDSTSCLENDLQVMVVPFHQTVTLMCSTGCSPTQHSRGYIWYRNGEVLYRDRSPWYRQLVSGDRAVKYSCAIKGCTFRAPEVSVDSVNSTCFTVTYQNGQMCSGEKGKSEPCTITYPREVHVGHTLVDQDHVSLTCDSSCAQTDHLWYKNRRTKGKILSLIPLSSTDVYSCAVRGHEELFSDEVCVNSTNCWKFKYPRRRVCVLEGTERVNISCEYSHPHYDQPQTQVWLKTEMNTQEEAKKLNMLHRVKYSYSYSHSVLMINNIKLNDSGKYFFTANEDEVRKQRHGYPGVSVIVTGLRVDFVPSAEVTEGQRVTLTCTTSCPLTDDTKYLWFLDNNLTGTNDKHLVLDPVSGRDAGKYTCRVSSQSSHGRILRVKSELWPPAVIGVLVTVVLILPIVLSAVFCRIRRKMSSNRSPEPTTYDTVTQSDLLQEDEHLYSSIADPDHHHRNVYTSVRLHPPQEPEHIHYSVVRVKLRE